MEVPVGVFHPLIFEKGITRSHDKVGVEKGRDVGHGHSQFVGVTYEGVDGLVHGKGWKAF